MADRLFSTTKREPPNSDLDGFSRLADSGQREGGPRGMSHDTSPRSRLDAFLANSWRKDSHTRGSGNLSFLRVDSPEPLKDSRLSVTSLVEEKPLSPQKDQVLIRCRETIERLHSEVEEERNKRKDAQKKAQTLDSSYSQAVSDLDAEKQRLRDQEALTRRTRMDLKHSEQRMQRLESVKEENARQLNVLKQDHVAREREKDLRIRDLEQSLTSADMQAGSFRKQSVGLETQVIHLTEEKERLKVEGHRVRTRSEDGEQMHQEQVRQLEELARVRQDQAQQQVDELKVELRKQQEEFRSVEAVTHRYEELQTSAKHREQAIREELVQRGKQIDRAEQQTNREMVSLRTKVEELQRDAERHLALKEHLLAESRESHVQLTEQHLSNDSHQRELKRYITETTSMKEEIDNCRRLSEKSSDERRMQQEKLFALSIETAERQHTLDRMEKAAEEKADEYERELRRKEGFVITQNQEMQELQQRLEEAIRKLQLELADARSTAQLEQERRKDVERILESEQNNHELSNERLDRNAKELDFARQKLEKTEAELQQMHLHVRDSQTQLIGADIKLTQHVTALKAVEEERDEARKERDETRKERDDAQKDISAHKQKIADILVDSERKVSELQKEAELQAVDFARKQETMHVSISSQASEAVAKLKRKFETKIQRLHKQLAERENYEQKLKSLLEMEVGNVAKLYKELDHSQAMRIVEPTRYHPGYDRFSPTTPGPPFYKMSKQAPRQPEYIIPKSGIQDYGDDDLGLERFSIKAASAGPKLRAARANGRSAERFQRSEFNCMTGSPRPEKQQGSTNGQERWVESSDESDAPWMKDVVSKVQRRVLRSLAVGK
eukprot:GEMP01007059.1.p1 GENE.GEMP01007059.1~~GEMP01007059.1.p1  ORF type:complete len:845 (+),score=215.93 GEMP01007059.1:150-2684(+)